MQSLDIHTAIAELTGLYDNLNKRFGCDPCSTDVYQVSRQREYRDALEQLKGAYVESIALKIIAGSVNENILSRLRGLIRKNIQIYENRREDFNSIDFDKLYSLWEDHLFGNKRALLLKDKETIKDYPYPAERERESLLKENQQDINELYNERSELRKADALWIGKNYYLPIYELSCSFASILDHYFPVETNTEAVIKKTSEQPEAAEPVKPAKSANEINPDTIFIIKMFDKFREIEVLLIKDAYLDNNLNWLPKHKNGKPDIKRLIVFLTGLLDNDYFLPNRDPKIKAFFESRYRISIGQNFERRRREPLVAEYKVVFYDYQF